MRTLFIIILATLIPVIGLAEQKSNRIAVVINKYLYAETSDIFSQMQYKYRYGNWYSLRDEVNRYLEDLKNEGYEPILKEWSLEEQPSPKELKDYLKGLYEEGGLQGTVFIGDLPIAIMEAAKEEKMDPKSGYQGPFPTDHYYMDLESDAWQDTNNNKIFDLPIFTPENTAKRAIWVSRIKASHLKSSSDPSADEVALIKDYLQKNHEFRTGERLYKERSWNYINSESVQQMVWLNVYESYAIFDKKADFFIGDLSKKDFIKLLTKNSNELGMWILHGDTNKIWVNSSNEPIYSDEVYEYNIETAFIFPVSCWIGDYTTPYYFAGALLFSKNSGIQTMIVATTPTRLWERNLMAYPFHEGQNFGESYLSYLKAKKYSNIYGLSDERARVILGDGTLKRQRYIIGEDKMGDQTPILRSEALRYNITPSSVVPAINNLRFDFSNNLISWDRYYIEEGLEYILGKTDADGTERIIYQGKDNWATDDNLKRGENYNLTYRWTEGKSVTAKEDSKDADKAMRMLKDKNLNLVKYILKIRETQEIKDILTSLEYVEALSNTDAFQAWLAAIDIAKANEKGEPIVDNLLENPKMLELALEAGADPNISITDDPNDKPIFKVIESNNSESLMLLLKHGVNFNVLNVQGRSPLTRALYHKNWIMLDMLLAAGVNIDQADSNGETPLIIQALLGNLDETLYLIEHGANLAIRDKRGMTALDYAMLMKHKEIKEVLTEVSLEHATKLGEIDAFKAWVATIDFDEANENNEPIAYSLVGNPEILALALEAEADPDIPSSRHPNDRPIFKAIESNNLESLLLLLDYGATLAIKNEMGMSPLDYAKKLGYKDIEEILQARAQK